ncbi:hypothetical protein Taro_021095 [Colocasia esculenta]|uniref:Uncharacterized protein n=1 Tax=Colocasia esculenta TaxID=4460 RepID=A0A843VAG9_COLES|nr:hypothetical protein [Colocasia esculenta]
MEELRSEVQQSSDSAGAFLRSKASPAPSQQQISVTVVTEFVRWNEEAISRCTLFSSQFYAWMAGSGRLGESDPADPDSGRVGSVEPADSNGVWPTLGRPEYYM